MRPKTKEQDGIFFMRTLWRHPGFTLAELLIALAILGVIATFTIPKVLIAQQNSKYISMAKEAAGMISGAYQAYQNANTGSSTLAPTDLTSYMNYVQRDTSTIIDDIPGVGTYTCDAGAGVCLKLHNGAMLLARSWITFSGTSSTNAIYFSFDPDGISSNFQSVDFFIYYNGLLTSTGNLVPNTVSSDATRNAVSSSDPTWFNW